MLIERLSQDWQRGVSKTTIGQQRPLLLQLGQPSPLTSAAQKDGLAYKKVPTRIIVTSRFPQQPTIFFESIQALKSVFSTSKELGRMVLLHIWSCICTQCIGMCIVHCKSFSVMCTVQCVQCQMKCHNWGVSHCPRSSRCSEVNMGAATYLPGHCKTHLMKYEKCVCVCSKKQTVARVRSHWSHPTDTTVLSSLKKHKSSSCASSEHRGPTQRCICCKMNFVIFLFVILRRDD